MCGIVGYVGPREAAPLLMEGLKRLEYRGYDSAGIATLANGHFAIHRSPGKLSRLIDKLAHSTSPGSVGIGHTRWATHGRPTEVNAHPHTDCSGRIVVVHNGIFENFAERKSVLAAAGHRFVSETDTEVFAHEVEAAFQGDLFAAVRQAAQKLTGAYAV
ncbi:MAG TPA: glutamine--fructose-6-phosphate aminotransferase, partial [Thermoanaerobaculia bacterium]|nr:glutamine--fructose-6-phosphate aminotransferase [Thermoanaerobaculia bacterium]